MNVSFSFFFSKLLDAGNTRDNNFNTKGLINIATIWDAVLDTGKWQMVKTELVTVSF